MRRSAGRWLGLLIVGTPLPAFAGPAACPAPCAQTPPNHTQGGLFSEDDGLLLEVQVGETSIADSLLAYASPKGVFLPLGDLTRALDLAVRVDGPDQKASGWVLRQSRTLSLDLCGRTARLGGQTIPITADEAKAHGDEIYLRLDLMEKLLPIAFTLDERGLVLRLQPREPLPFQERLERERRSRALSSSGGEQPTVLKVVTPYLIASPPSFDLTMDGSAGTATPSVAGSYELRAAGDLAFAAMHAFAGSDAYGHLLTVRVTLGRTDDDGHLLGPLRAREFELGDTFTPSLALGERSVAGRGFMVSSTPIDAGGVSSHLDVHGELPEGWEVELYVNQVLVASQATPIQGRYEFPNVPLSFGLNVLRLVFYGPHGEQREEVRRYNFGGGRPGAGQVFVRLGVVQQSENVANIPLPPGPGGAPMPEPIAQGAVRAAAQVQYGLSSSLALDAGFARYTPLPGNPREVVETGLQSSVSGVALQLDAAKDLAGGEAEALTLAGRLAGATLMVRDSEYQGLFYDETQPIGVLTGAPLARSAELRLDWVQRGFVAGPGIPVSLDMQYDRRQDGSTYTTGDVRASDTTNGYLLSSSLGFSGETGDAFRSLWGELDASRGFGSVWQVRGGVQYQLLPAPAPQSVFLDVDRALSKHNDLRLALNQSLTSRYDSTVQLTDTWRLKKADIALTASYDAVRHDARLQLQLSLGLMYDPAHGGYRLVRPGATSRGEAELDAFTDNNGDGRRESGDAPVENLTLDGAGSSATTDKDGQALITASAEGPPARIRVKADAVDDPYAVTPADIVQFAPRPGRVTEISFGLKRVGEVQLRLALRQADGSRKGVSSLDVQLVGTNDLVVAEGHTEFDGTMVVEKLAPGAYAVRIEPEQARRLGLALAKPVTVRIPPEGGYVGNVDGEVTVRP